MAAIEGFEVTVADEVLVVAPGLFNGVAVEGASEALTETGTLLISVKDDAVEVTEYEGAIPADSVGLATVVVEEDGEDLVGTVSLAVRGAVPPVTG